MQRIPAAEPMALFGFGKDKREAGTSDLVMAYLEDAQRVRSPFLVKDARKVEFSAVIQGLNEEAGTLNFQINGPFSGEKASRSRSSTGVWRKSQPTSNRGDLRRPLTGRYARGR